MLHELVVESLVTARLVATGLVASGLDASRLAEVDSTGFCGVGDTGRFSSVRMVNLTQH